MHVLIALTYYRPHYSGLTIYAERLANSLAERGHQVTILTSRFDPALKLREVCSGVEIIRPWVWFRLSKGVIMPGMPKWAWQLVRQADVINLHVPQLDAAPIAVLSRLLGKPVVLTYHCDMRLPAGFVHSIANQASNLANHISARAANVIVQNSRDYAENSSFLRHYLSKVIPIAPPVALAPVTEQERAAFRQKYGIQPGQRIIGMAARLATEKGVEFLAQALPAILERFPQARVLHVGPYKDVLGEERYADRVMEQIAPVQEHWTWLGAVPPAEMSAFFYECEVLALPSLNSTESYGIVQVEAMACGTPVAVSDLPGVRVPVQESGMGVIVPTANSAELGRAIIQILENPAQYRQGGERLVRRSTPEAVAVAYEAIFARLVGPTIS